MCRLFILALSCLALLAGGAARAEFPDRPLRLIIPFGGGGGIDAGGRSLGQGLARQLGRPVVVENRPGANSVIGAKAVAESSPDGHTLLFTSGSTVSVLPHISPSLPFDPQRDLIPAGKVAKMPFVLLVHDSVGADSLPEFLRIARERPGELTYASAGSGTGAHLGFELLKQHAKVDITHVPYKATAEAIPDLTTGRVLSMMADPATARRTLALGGIRALAVTTVARDQGFPDVPSVAEQGVEGFDLELWFGVFVPRGTPEAAVRRLNEAMQAALGEAETAAAFGKLGFQVDASTPEQLGELAERESRQWEALAATGALGSQ